MKKNLLSVLALMLALLAWVTALFSIGAIKKDNENLTTRLNTLQAQIDELRRDLEEMQALAAAPEESPDVSCSLLADSWTAMGNTLTADIFAVVQLEEGLEVSQAQLQLICGEQSQLRDIEMRPGEGEDCFEADLPGLSFDLPEMENGDELTLELIVTITGGRCIHAQVHWYLEDDTLYLVSG